MRKFGLFASSALRSAVFVSVALGSGAALAQAAEDPQEKAQPNEGAPGVTAPGTNPATTPSDEEPTQEELDPNAPEANTILVTGSRIPRPQFEGNIPGAQVTSEQIEARGFTNMFDVLNDLPLIGPTGANPYGLGGQQAIALGISFADLLDLGSNRTLTLVNGRRFVSGNSATIFGPGGEPGVQVDLSVIPAALVSRVDVLTVGGAAAYGSDAVAGVINVILKDDFQGVQIKGLSSVTGEGDLPNYNLSIIAGTNFGGGRGNVTAAYEYDFAAAGLGTARSGLTAGFLNGNGPPNLANGAQRNPNFVPSLTIDQTSLNNAAFLRASDDGIPGSVFASGLRGGSVLLSNGGTIFQATTPAAITAPVQGLAVIPATPANLRPNGFALVGSATAVIPFGPVPVNVAGCSPTTLATFCRFAPASLPAGVTPQQVINRFAPGFNTTGATPAQLSTLAVNLLQANLPTIEEYFRANPNLDPNLVLGGFVPGLPDVANTDPATAALFPRVARPIRFNNAGDVVSFVAGRPIPGTSSVLGSSVGADFERTEDGLLRVQQERHIGNLVAHYNLTDNIRVYTENLYAKVKSVSPRTVNPSNLINTTSTEVTSLVLNTNNPFLDAGDRAALAAANISGNFLLSRTNGDISEGIFTTGETETYRTLVGTKADFGLFGRSMSFDVAGSYARAKTVGAAVQIKDIEYALAIDAVRNPANGQIVCRSQLSGQVGLPPGVQARELIREVGPGGIITERLFDRTVSAAQIAACQPLNPFGYNQMSTAAKDYVRANTLNTNVGEQYFSQASLSGSLFDLPAGPLGFAFSGEFRRESFDFKVDELSRIGGTRQAAFANTKGRADTMEFGAEARIPILGEGFNIPLFRNLEISPAVRMVRQRGRGPDVRRLNGRIDEQRANGEWNSIWSLAGTWRPIQDITLRGNVTRSIRSASVVELFLGGQPTLVNGFQDVCSTTNIGAVPLGADASVRRRNCEAAVVAAGLATNSTGAAAFLAGYTPPPQSILGTVQGSPEIQPERGRSWTVGAVAAPRFIPGLTLSADYIHVEIKDRIVPVGFAAAVQGCYDSPNFPNTQEFGINFCDRFSRFGPDSPTPFQFQPGFTGSFRNQGAVRVRGVNLSGLYNLPLNNVFGGSDNLGRLQLASSAYHLLEYREALTNDLSAGPTTVARSEGTLSRPEWEVQLRARYDVQGFFAQWVTNWQSKTSLSYGINEENGAEFFDIFTVPAVTLHNAALGWNLGQDQRFGLTFSVSNVFDKRYVGQKSVAYSTTFGLVDPIGRRFTVSANVKF
jgi:outer membrane receptor protein involved in Fe transport